MKKGFIFLFLIFIFPCLAMSAESKQFIGDLGFVLLNENKDVDVGKIFFGRFHQNHPTQHLSKGESIKMSDGHHAFQEIKYLGYENNQLSFEIINTFNAVSFGGDITTKNKIITIQPYTFEQFVSGNEQKIAEELLLDTEFYMKERTYETWLKNWLQKEGLEKRDSNGNTFLLKAIDKHAIQFLLNLGANLHAVNNKGENILMRQMSIWSNLEPKMLKFLLKKGIDKNHRNLAGKTIRDIILEKLQNRKKNEPESHWLWENDKINLEILTDKDDCSGIYDDKTERCLDCLSPEILEENFSDESAKKLCDICPNRYLLAGGCHLNIKTTTCHQNEKHWMSYFDDGIEDECHPCEQGDLRMTTFEECKRCPNHIAEANPDINYMDETYNPNDSVVMCYSCFTNDIRILRDYPIGIVQKYCSNWREITEKIKKYNSYPFRY